MDNHELSSRLANLSPAKRALLEQKLKPHGVTATIAQGIPRKAERLVAPLSFAQQRLWFLSQLEPNSSSYNESNGIRLVGPLDTEALRHALNKLTMRHEVLRTTIVVMDGHPQQVIRDPSPVDLPVVDMRGTLPNRREAEAYAAFEKIARRPFDLSRDLPLRALLVRLDDQEHILFKVIHHIASDGWSSGILWRELGQYYREARSGTYTDAADLPIQYQDYAAWQRDWLQGEILETQLSYWRKQLKDIPELQLSTDNSRTPGQKSPGAKAHLDLDPNLADALKQLSKAKGVTPFMTFLAACQVLLHRYTGQDDIAVGSPIAGRTRPEVEGLIGFFVNTMVLRMDLSNDPTFEEVLAQARDVALGAYAHQELPFERIVEELNPKRDLNTTPLFRVMFAYQNAPRSPAEFAGLESSQVEVPSGEAKFDLFLAVLEKNHGLSLRLDYAADLFHAASIERTLVNFQTLLKSIVDYPERRLSKLDLVTDAERQRLLIEWNDTATEYPRDKCVHALFEEQAQKTPGSIAVTSADRQLTYEELNRQANRVARYLRKQGIGPEVCVGICMNRSLDLIIGLLAILKAGGAYLPLDPQYPQARLAFMLNDSHASVLLTEKTLLDSMVDAKAFDKSATQNRQVICLDRDWREIEAQSDETLDNVSTADNLAYVMYTSGSTGKPKGVEVVHRGIARLVFGSDYAQLDANQAILQLAPVAFDASTFEIWGALLHGGKCVLYPERVPSPQDLGEIIKRQGVTTLWLTASLFNTLIDEVADTLSGVHQLLIGGEALSVAHVRRGLEWLPHTEMINGYGPTESTTFTCCYRIPRSLDENNLSVPIGKAIGNTKVYILDRQMNPVPIGVIGELCIGGDGLARGYLNRPELTAERFITHSFDGEPAQRLYRTGDLAHYLPDGNIEFVGRIDNQVKIRGYRIELGEIETVLAQHPGVRETVVLAREDATAEHPGAQNRKSKIENLKSDKRLVAYVVAAPGLAPSVNELRSFLNQKLPEYMAPSTFMFLESLPLTPNGKLDRKALPIPEHTRPELEESYEAPRTQVEELLVQIWLDMLKVDKVGIHDNFFHLGGHSLLGTQVLSRVNNSFQIDIPLRRLFESPTIAGLASAVDGSIRMEGGPQSSPPIESLPRSSEIPLSFAQQRLWILDRLAPGRATYNVPAAFRLVGELNVHALEESLSEMARRHEVLRTIFVTVNGDPLQKILPPSPVLLPYVDMSVRPESERAQALADLASEAAEQPFDLNQGPLLRVQLLCLAPQDHVLLVNLHHIVTDGWSMGVLFRELSALYEGYCSGKPSLLPELRIQYADYSVWQRQWLQGEALEKQLSYWRKKLDGLSTLQLPTDRARPAVQTYQGASRPVDLSAPLSEAIKTLSRQEGVTPFMTLLAAFQVLLSRYTGQTDIAVGSPIANRTRTEIEGLIGFFVNTLVLRSDLSNQPTFKQLLREVRETTLEAYSHQDLPFEKLVDELHPDRNPSHSPLFQVMFVFQNTADQPLAFKHLKVNPIRINSQSAKFDLTLTLSETDGKLRGSINYNTDLFDQSTIERMIGHFRTLLEGIVAEPEQYISELSLLTESERHRLLVEWNDTKTDYPKDKCVHELFEQQIERTPDAVALVFEDQQLTYRELNNRANQLAHYLVNKGFKPGTFVGVYLERSIDVSIALLGILKAGGVYVPLDPSYPRERIDFILRDTQAPTIVTLSRLSQALLPLASPAAVVCLDSDGPTIVREVDTNPRVPTTPDNVAYVIYTSGSTGIPKGVLGLHRGLVNRFAWMWSTYPFGTNEVCCQKTSLNFVDSLWELLGPLAKGVPSVVLRDSIVKDAVALVDALRRHAVTRIVLVPSLLRIILETHPNLRELLPQLRFWVTSGEAISRELTEYFASAFPHGRLINLYGCSEVSADVTYFEIDSESLTSQRVPIGRPLSNTQTYILDRNFQTVPIGIAGELHIGGAGLALGYLHRTELTTEKFVPNPFNQKQGTKLYRTGDLARYLPDGKIEYLGRIDNQVKVRGFRIELGEVEAVITQHPSVREAVVITQDESPESKKLAAYVVLREGAVIAPTDLKNFLEQRLPEFMIPSAFCFPSFLPLTASGKVNRLQLPAFAQSDQGVLEPALWPRDHYERRLIEIWKIILGVSSLGVQDNFFQVGGHSLLALRMLARVEREFNRAVRLAAVFERPTIEKLADLLRDPGKTREWNWLVPLHVGGSKPPFFLLHGSRELANQIAADQPVYGAQPHGLDGRRAPSKLEEMAAEYLTEIRMLQPEGPYFIGGYSLGGLVAFEAAQQLKEQDQEVTLLVMLDPTIPGGGGVGSKSLGFTGSGITQRNREVAKYLKRFGSISLSEAANRICDRLNWKFNQVMGRVKMLACTAMLGLGQKVPARFRRFYFMKAGLQAARNYIPKVYNGRVIILSTENSERNHASYWSRLVGLKLDIYKMPGGHLDAIQGAHVKAWGEQLGACLRNR